MSNSISVDIIGSQGGDFEDGLNDNKEPSAEEPASDSHSSSSESPQPTIPPELLLVIAQFLPPRTLLELCLSSRSTFGLLLPTLYENIDDRFFSTVESISNFAQDELETDKFELVKNINMMVRPRIPLFLEHNILEKCKNLQFVRMNVFTPESLVEVGQQSTWTRHLELNFLRSVELDHDFTFQAPELKTLRVTFLLPDRLLETIVANAPNLESIDACLFSTASLPSLPEPLLSLSPLVVSKIKIWTLTSFAWLDSILSTHPLQFHPEKLVQWNALRNWNQIEVWQQIVKLDSLRHVELLGVPVGYLGKGLPRCLETGFVELKMSLLGEQEELVALGKTLALAPKELKMSCRFDGTPQPRSLQEAEMLARTWRVLLGSGRVDIEGIGDAVGGEFAAVADEETEEARVVFVKME